MLANTRFSDKTALYIRLGIGLVFGLVLALLVTSDQHYNITHKGHASPYLTLHIILFNVLSMGAFVLWAGAAVMRRLSFMVWGLIVFVLIGYIAWHQNAAEPMQNLNPIFKNGYLILPLLFIANELVSSADQAGKPIAPYRLYFDEAWKRGVQLGLALLFTGLFWAILGLGAALLGIIGIKWFAHLIANSYFAFAATGMAMGISVHLGDVQPKLLASVRSLVLGVLSWLLLVIAVVGTIFAVSLLFTGLKPLWDTKAATVTLLSFCVALVLLINAAYQQGDTERPVNIVMKWATRSACVLLLIFSAIAAISLKLRIDQYGLTMDRVIALLAVIIALAYGVAYAFCALWPKGRWMALIEPSNIGLAMLKCVLFLAILTPITDPRRLGVDDQVSRLIHAKVSSEKFDWAMLRYEGGTYGKVALKKLSLSPIYGPKAKEVLGWNSEDSLNHRIDEDALAHSKLKIDPKFYNIIAPKGAQLPESFVTQTFERDSFPQPPCVTHTETKPCEVILIDLNDDKAPEMLILSDHYLGTIAFDKDTGWYAFTDNIYLTDAEVVDFRAANVKAIKPEWNDIAIGKNKKALRQNRRD